MEGQQEAGLVLTGCINMFLQRHNHMVTAPEFTEAK